MSAIGINTSIVSLGSSCQTAWQINKNIEFLSNLTGDDLQKASCPFDWLIVPCSGLVSWLNSGDFFPAGPEEIVVHPNFRWARHNLHFWHEFARDGAPALEATFDQTRAKFTFLMGRLAVIRSLRRRVFFVSNTQDNLDEVSRVSPQMDLTFRRASMLALVEAVHSAFGVSEIHFVTRPDRIEPEAFAGGFSVHLVGSGPDIAGDDAGWRDVFRAALGSGTAAVQQRAA